MDANAESVSEITIAITLTEAKALRAYVLGDHFDGNSIASALTKFEYALANDTDTRDSNSIPDG